MMMIGKDDLIMRCPSCGEDYALPAMAKLN